MQRRNNFGLRKLATALMLWIFLIGYLPASAFANHVSVSLTTDKACYNLGSNVGITFANTGQTVSLTDGRPWDIYDVRGNLVYSPLRDMQMVDVDNGESLSWIWNQKTQAKNPVAVDTYFVVIPIQRVSPNDGQDYSSQFSIGVDRDEDCIDNTNDICPDDASNTCVAANPPSPPNGGAPGGGDENLLEQPIKTWIEIKRTISAKAKIECTDTIRDTNPLGDFDSDGTHNWSDECPCLSGNANSKTGTGCPDYEVKEAARTWATDFIYGETATTIGAGAVAVVAIVAGPFTLGTSWIIAALAIGLATEELIGDVAVAGMAAIQIAHDPPDANFKEVVSMRAPEFTIYDDSENKQLGTANKIISSGANIVTITDAFVRANEKFMGAEQVDDYYWMLVHAKEVRQYATALVQSMMNYNSASDELAKLVTQFEGIARELNLNVDLTITKSKLVEFQNKIRTAGAEALPQAELDLVTQSGWPDSSAQLLADNILSINPDTWVDGHVNSKISENQLSMQNMARSLLSYSANLGSNVVLGEMLQTQLNKFAKVLPINLVKTPELAHTILIGIKYDAKNYKYLSIEPVMDLPNAQVLVTESTPGQLVIMVHSKQGIAYGTSGTLFNLQLVARGLLGKLSAIAPQIVPSPSPIIFGLSGDASGWLYPTAANKNLPTATTSISSIPIFKNNKWVFTNAPITSPPQVDASQSMTVWDGLQWLIVPKQTLSQVFDVGTKQWTFTRQMPPTQSPLPAMPTPQFSIYKYSTWVFVNAPTTSPPQVDMLQSMTVWDGAQWLIVPRPTQFQVFDVGTKQWTLTNQMPKPIKVKIVGSSPPQIQTIPDQIITASSEALNLQIAATDVDGDTLTYYLKNAPAGMSVSLAGLVTWSPTNSQANTDYSVVIVVSDGINRVSSNLFKVKYAL